MRRSGRRDAVLPSTRELHRSRRREKRLLRKEQFGEEMMKHKFPKWNKYKMEWEAGPTSPRKKRGPKIKGPQTKCPYCDNFFFSKKQRSKHIQLSHRGSRTTFFDENGLPLFKIHTPIERRAYTSRNYPL
jgi:hypothetical protein